MTKIAFIIVVLLSLAGCGTLGEIAKAGADACHDGDCK